MNTQTTNATYTISNDIFKRLSQELAGNEGSICTEIEVGELAVVFEGSYYIDDTCENDYNSGTGASYITYASLALTCTVYDPAGDEIANDYRDQDFENYLLN